MRKNALLLFVAALLTAGAFFKNRAHEARWTPPALEQQGLRDALNDFSSDAAGVLSAAREQSATVATLPGQSVSGRQAAGRGTAPQGHGYTLLSEPTSGRTQILSLLKGAQSAIDLTIYEIEDPLIITALADAAKRGVQVRVLYNFYSFQKYGHDPNAPYIAELKKAGVKTKPAGEQFAITHQKTLVIDGSAAVIMTFNLAPGYFSGTRDFGIITYDAGQVAEIGKVFEADWAYKSVSVSEPALVWSPDNSREKILGVIKGAAKTLEVYNEETEDPQCMQALIAAAKRGVKVRFITAILKNGSVDGNAAERQVLNAHGVKAEGLASPFIHAKIVLADAGGTAGKAYLGSENFSSYSLDKNRELGIILEDPAILSSIHSTFDSDWVK